MRKVWMILAGVLLISLGLQAQSTTTYYPNNTVKATYTAQDNGLIAYVKYAEDATVLETGFYNELEKIGQWQYFDAAGNLRMEEAYVNGLRDGVSLKYDATGAPTHQIVYKDGVRIGAYLLDLGGIVLDSRDFK